MRKLLNVKVIATILFILGITTMSGFAIEAIKINKVEVEKVNQEVLIKKEIARKQAEEQKKLEEVKAKKLEEERINKLPKYKSLASLNVRNMPKDGKIIKVITPGHVIRVENIKDGWAKLSDGNYVASKYICKENEFKKKMQDRQKKHTQESRVVSRGATPQMYYVGSSIFTSSGETAQSLQAKLNGQFSGLKPLASAAIQLQNETGINAHITIAIAALESGWGKRLAASNNFYGLRTDSRYLSFSSPYQCVKVFGKSILSYKKSNLIDINPIYCPPNPNWKYEVVNIANQLRKM